MDVKTDIGIGEPDAGTLAVFLVEEVGNGILDTIGDKSRVVEVLAIDCGVDGKCRLNGHQLLPVKGLELLIQVVGAGGAQLEERLEHAHCRAAGEIGAIQSFLVARERNDAVTLSNILGAQGA